MRKKDLYRYVYPIHKKYDLDMLTAVCKHIESNFGGLIKEKPFGLFDLTAVQKYSFGDRKIAVYCDGSVDAVYVCSDVDLSGVLGVESIY